MTCLTCQHAALRSPDDPKRDAAVKAMARCGYANCTLSVFGASFHPLGHTCISWIAAPAEVVEARQVWAQRKEVAHG